MYSPLTRSDQPPSETKGPPTVQVVKPGAMLIEPEMPVPVMTCEAATVFKMTQSKMTDGTLLPISATLGVADTETDGVGPEPPPMEGSSLPSGPRRTTFPASAVPADTDTAPVSPSVYGPLG